MTVRKKKVVKRRRKNPNNGAGRRGKVKKAAKLYRRFREEEPKFIDNITVPEMDVCMHVGKCDGILYTTRKNGKTEKYIHEFTGRSKPELIASWDGKQIGLIGGDYDFTDEGIVDRK